MGNGSHATNPDADEPSLRKTGLYVTWYLRVMISNHIAQGTWNIEVAMR